MTGTGVIKMSHVANTVASQQDPNTQTHAVVQDNQIWSIDSGKILTTHRGGAGVAIWCWDSS